MSRLFVTSLSSASILVLFLYSAVDPSNVPLLYNSNTSLEGLVR